MYLRFAKKKANEVKKSNFILNMLKKLFYFILKKLFIFSLWILFLYFLLSFFNII